jgi:hypothetical protein
MTPAPRLPQGDLNGSSGASADRRELSIVFKQRLSAGEPLHRHASTDGDQGYTLALIVACDSHRPGIEGHLPIGNIDVTMMAVVQLHADASVAVRTPLHGVCVRVPAVEIADEADVPGLGGVANLRAALRIFLARAKNLSFFAA